MASIGKPGVHRQVIQTAEICAELNQMAEGFRQVFTAMDALQKSAVAAKESLRGCRLLAEQASSWACHQIAEILRDRELQNWTRTEHEWHRWQKQNLDDDQSNAPVPQGRSLAKRRKA